MCNYLLKHMEHLKGTAQQNITIFHLACSQSGKTCLASVNSQQNLFLNTFPNLLSMYLNCFIEVAQTFYNTV